MIQVAGRLERTLADLERAALVLLEEEQGKIAPDNSLIAVLCDTVRLIREYLEHVKVGIAKSGEIADLKSRLAALQAQRDALEAALTKIAARDICFQAVLSKYGQTIPCPCQRIARAALPAAKKEKQP